MSTDPQAAPRPLPDRPNLRHLKDQAKDLLKAGAAASLTDAQFKIARLYGFASWPKLKAHVDSLGGDRATQAGDRHQRPRSRQDHDDAQPGAAQCSAGLRQGRAAHLGCRMPRPLGVTESGEAGHGDVDDRARVGRAPGRRRTADASRAQWISHPDDGASRVPRRGCERLVARTFPHHLCPLRVVGSGRSQMASRSRRKSELPRPWVRGRRPSLSGHGSRLPHRVVRAFARTTERLHRRPSRGRWRDQIRRASCAGTAPRPARSIWPS